MLLEYFAAPEYYQMPLRVDELRQQVSNLIELLQFDNYSLCLCPEAVDICFELRGDAVTIRSDRRNKSQPRQGRVASVRFTNRAFAEVFEREFWSLYRATEIQFKDKTFIADWLVTEASKYLGPTSERAV